MIFDYIKKADPRELRFLLDGYRMNLALAEDGLKQDSPGERADLSGFRSAGTKGYRPTFSTGLWIICPHRSKIRSGFGRRGVRPRMGGSLYLLWRQWATGPGHHRDTSGRARGGTLRSVGRRSHTRPGSKLPYGLLCQDARRARFGVCLCAIASSAGVAGGIGFLKGLDEEKIRAAVKNVISPLAGMLATGPRMPAPSR